MKAMICLVSRQAMPNVIPILMYKPQLVYLLMTEEERRCGYHLKNLFCKKNIEVKKIRGISAYNELTINDTIKNILTELRCDDLTLNITGGTKLMAIGAYEIFRQNKLPIIYCNTEQREIVHLLPDRKVEPIKIKVTIEDYLLAYGYSIEDEKDKSLNATYNPLFTFICSDNEKLNEYTNFANKVRSRFNDNLNSTINSETKIFKLQKTTRGYFLTVPSANINLKFPDKRFILGDWLEYYSGFQLSKKYDGEYKIGVKIISDNSVKNEIDLLLLKDYKLYLFSCKSSKAQNDALFELDSLRSLAGGTFGKALVILSDNRRAKDLDFYKARARDLNVVLIDSVEKLNEFEL